MDNELWQLEKKWQNPERKTQHWLFYVLGTAAMVSLISAVAVGSHQLLSSKKGLVLGLEQNKFWQRIAGETITLDSSVYDPNSITVIANFEKKENWQGNAIFEDQIVYEGENSLALVSSNGNPATVSLMKVMNLSAAQFIELVFNVANPDNFEQFSLDFGNADFQDFYRFNFTNLTAGWRLWQIDKEKFSRHIRPNSDFDWSKIQAVRLVLKSRPDSLVLVRADMLQAVNNAETYLKHWQVRDSGRGLLGLVEYNGNIVLAGRGGSGSQVATLKNTETQSDFVFSASFSPQSPGRSGLFFGDYQSGNGVYFLIFGNESRWQIKTKDNNGWSEGSPESKIGDLIFSSQKKYWLKIERENNKISFLVSVDNISFEELDKIEIGGISRGSVGIAVLDNSFSIFDNFEFKGY